MYIDTKKFLSYLKYFIEKLNNNREKFDII